jgi:hypothetical protein
MGGGAVAAQAPPGEGNAFRAKGMNVDIVDSAITSTAFWGYMHMTDYIAEAIAHVMHWAEACPCHQNAGMAEMFVGAHRHRANSLVRHIGQPVCCMASRRAPECAAGHLMILARRLLSMANTEVLMSPYTLACNEADRALILGDFARARRHILFQMQLKFSHWRQLPWLLWGVAHHSRLVAVECASRALSLFHHSVVQGGERPHWMAAMLCTPGTQGWAEMVAFINGEELSRLPLLERMCAIMKFSMVAERWIESRHALIRKDLRRAPHHSVLHIAYCGIQHLLRTLLNSQPEFLNELTMLCTQARNPMMAVQSAGFLKHPVVQHLLSKETRRDLGRNCRRELVELLYHVDSLTLYQDVPDSEPFHLPPPGPPQDPGPQPGPPPGPPPGHPPAPGPPPDDDDDHDMRGDAPGAAGSSGDIYIYTYIYVYIYIYIYICIYVYIYYNIYRERSEREKERG